MCWLIRIYIYYIYIIYIYIIYIYILTRRTHIIYCIYKSTYILMFLQHIWPPQSLRYIIYTRRIYKLDMAEVLGLLLAALTGSEGLTSCVFEAFWVLQSCGRSLPQLWLIIKPKYRTPAPCIINNACSTCFFLKIVLGVWEPAKKKTFKSGCNMLSAKKCGSGPREVT